MDIGDIKGGGVWCHGPMYHKYILNKKTKTCVVFEYVYSINKPLNIILHEFEVFNDSDTYRQIVLDAQETFWQPDICLASNIYIEMY